MFNFHHDVKFRPGHHNKNEGDLSLIDGPDEEPRRSDEKAFLSTFSQSTKVYDKMANQCDCSVYINKISTIDTFLSLQPKEIQDLQRPDSIIARFLGLWDQGQKPTKREIQKLPRPVVTLLYVHQWDKIV